MKEKSIRGFLHYREDLGEGTRTAVVFDRGPYRRSVLTVPAGEAIERSLREFPEEGIRFTADSLIQYLREDKVLCYTKKLGITFMGWEPMEDDAYSLCVARGIRDLGMDLHIWTCGLAPSASYDLLSAVTDLFVVSFVTPIETRYRPVYNYSSRSVMKTVESLLDRNYPVRIRVPVISGVNDTDAQRIASKIFEWQTVRSVMLDFSCSGLSEEEILLYRNAFLDRNILLYQ